MGASSSGARNSGSDLRQNPPDGWVYQRSGSGRGGTGEGGWKQLNPEEQAQQKQLKSKAGTSLTGSQPPPPPPVPVPASVAAPTPAPTPYYLTKSTTPTPAPAPPATSGSYWSEPSSRLSTSSTPTPAPTPPAGPFGSSFDIGEYIRANDTYSRWKGPSTSSTEPGRMAGDAQSTLGQLAGTQAQAQWRSYTDEARRRSKKSIN